MDLPPKWANNNLDITTNLPHVFNVGTWGTTKWQLLRGFQNPGWKIPGLRANQGQGIGKVLGKPGPRPRNLEVFHSQSIIMPRNTTALPLGDFRHISFHWMASLSAELFLHPQCWCSTELAQGTWTTNALLQTSNPNCKTPNLHACCLNHSKFLVNCIPICPLCFLKSQCWSGHLSVFQLSWSTLHPPTEARSSKPSWVNATGRPSMGLANMSSMHSCGSSSISGPGALPLGIRKGNATENHEIVIWPICPKKDKQKKSNIRLK